jgi:alkaline phosphatase D
MIRQYSSKTTYLSVFLFLFLIFYTTGFSAVNNADKTEYILFITADAFRPDYIERYNPPNLKNLIKEGVWVEKATNIFPTLTTPNMASLVTGAYPRTTQIAANSQYDSVHHQFIGGPRDNKAVTIAEALKKAGWKTAAVNQFMLQNRGVDHYVTAGYDNSERITKEAINFLKKDKVHFVSIIYGITDTNGHKYGPDSPEMKSTVLSIDTEIGKLMAYLKESGLASKTIICFSSDHGMSGFNKKQASTEPSALLKRAGYRVATRKEELRPDTQVLILAYGVRIIYFMPSVSDKDKDKEKITNLLSTIQGAEVLDRKKLDALGCHNNLSGDLIVSPLPGYVMSGANGKGGYHGTFDESSTIMIFTGPGVKKGTTIKEGRNIDIVPTLLYSVGVEAPSTVDGKPLKEIFK